MSFNGDTQLEKPEFEDIDTAYDYINDLGSKWYFYPFWFIVTNSGKTIVNCDSMFEFMLGKRVATVSRRFEELQELSLKNNETMDAEQFAFYVADNF
jgi:hypothetical protein